MITIEKINRASKIEKSGHILNDTFITRYIETEKEFIEGIESMCNNVKEVIAIQFLNGKQNEISGCIITYKE